MSQIKICFVIALKYYKDKHTSIHEYVINILNFYESSSVSILMVDNNSEDIEYIKETFKNNNNITIITNTSESKYELGAYNFGIKYILENNLNDNYDYFIFTQDSFIIHKKYDFNNLILNDIYACPLVGSDQGFFSGDLYNCIGYHVGDKDQNLIKDTIIQLGLRDVIPELTFCLANSFVLKNNKLNEFFSLTNHIKIENKVQSESSERFLAGVLYLLNNRKNNSIETSLVNNIMQLLILGNIVQFDYFKKYINGKQ